MPIVIDSTRCDSCGRIGEDDVQPVHRVYVTPESWDAEGKVDVYEFTGHEGTQPGLCFFELGNDGKIALITDFWPEPYELPASRADLVERY